MKRSAVFLFLLAFGVVGVASPAQADPGNGNAYGHGCELANGDDYDNPGEMIQALADRDGSIKATVDKYSSHFSSVGDLISKKCG